MLTELRNSGSQSSRAEEEGRRMAEVIVNHAPESNRPQVRELLKQLFPRIDWVFGGSHYGSGPDEQWFRDLRVCHPKMFDRYFHWYMRLGNVEDFVSPDVVAMKIEDLPIDNLTDQQRRAIAAFQEAMKRWQEGKSDDDWS